MISKPSGVGLFSQFMPHESNNNYNSQNTHHHHQENNGLNTINIVDSYGTKHKITPDHSGGGYDESGNYYYDDGEGYWSPSETRDGK